MQIVQRQNLLARSKGNTAFNIMRIGTNHNLHALVPEKAEALYICVKVRRDKPISILKDLFASHQVLKSILVYIEYYEIGKKPA